MKKLLPPLLVVLCVVMIVFLQLGFIFVLFALLPSITAFYIDNVKGSPTFKTVLTCNLAGMLPWLIPMIISGTKFKLYDSYGVISNPRVWMIVYGGAAVGWCLIYICSFAARFFIAALYEMNAASLEKFQKKLVDEWGEDIVPKKEEPAL